MLEQEIKNKIEELSEYSGFSVGLIQGWYEKLKEYNCFRDELACECLEVLCERRCSVNNDLGKDSFKESLTNSIQYALCDTFGDEAMKDIKIYNTTRNLFGYEFNDIDYDIQDDYMEAIDEEKTRN